jgi:hypothetical protein
LPLPFHRPSVREDLQTFARHMWPASDERPLHRRPVTSISQAAHKLGRSTGCRTGGSGTYSNSRCKESVALQGSSPLRVTRPNDRRCAPVTCDACAGFKVVTSKPLRACAQVSGQGGRVGQNLAAQPRALSVDELLGSPDMPWSWEFSIGVASLGGPISDSTAGRITPKILHRKGTHSSGPAL